MSLPAISLLFWLFAAAVVFRLLLGGRERAPRAVRWNWALLVLVWAGLILVRPHESFLAGEDPGAYLNAAASFARHGSVSFVDDMLSRVPPQDRDVFLFGHRGYGLTKDTCLHVTDLAAARVAPNFQPLYSIVISPFARWGHPWLMLCVVPLFALLMAVALGRLAGQILPHPAAPVLAPWLYLLTPLVVWHARAPRPEIIAGFLLCAGLALTIEAWRDTWPARWVDFLLAAVCLAVAPFFHVTAWFVLVPFCTLAGLAIMAGRMDFILYAAAVSAGVALFAWQALAVTDRYGLARFVIPFVRAHGPIWTLAALAAALAAGRWTVRGFGPALRQRLAASAGAVRLASRVARWGMAVLVAALFIALYLGATHGRSGHEYHYAHPTDLTVVTEYLSMPIVLLALAGLLRMIVATGPGAAEGRAVLLCLIPAACLIGNMYDVFMTRYLLLAVVPLTVLGLTAILTALPAQRPLGRRLLAPATVLAALLLLHGRTRLVTVTEQRGLLGFMRGFAERIQAENGILLAEYTRAAAPFEHVFGIPLLSFDNETRFDYEPGLQAWQAIMREWPARPAFFLTPYGAPVSDRFSFEPVCSDTLRFDRLVSRGPRLPTADREGSLTLNLYRMTAPPTPLAVFPYVRELDAGNMGLAGFSKVLRRPWDLAGATLGPDRPLHVALPGGTAETPVVFFFSRPAERAPPPQTALCAEASDAPPPAQRWVHLTNEWWTLQAWLPACGGATNAVAVKPGETLLLTDAAAGTGEAAGAVSLPRAEATAVSETSCAGRWARAECRFVAPVPPSGQGWLALAVKAPEDAGPRTLQLSAAGKAYAPRPIAVGRWTWQAWPLAGLTNATGYAWFTLNTDPPWNPHRTGYPEDLGVRVGVVAVLDGAVGAPRPAR